MNDIQLFTLLIIITKCRTAMVALVYEKSLHLSNAARQRSTVGEIVNHQAIDAQRFQQVSPHVHLVLIIINSFFDYY